MSATDLHMGSWQFDKGIVTVVAALSGGYSGGYIEW